MDKGQLQELIQTDLDGELSVMERAELARLLLRDPEARRLHNDFRRTDQLLRDIPKVEPPHGLSAAVLAGLAPSVRPAKPVQRQYGWPLYRMAAVILGGLLIVGISYLLLDGNSSRTDLQGSLGVAPQNQLSMRAAGVEVSASLRHEGERLRLEVSASTTMPCELIARIDPATTTFVGSAGDAVLTTGGDQVTVHLASGSGVFALDFAGAAPIQLQLRSGGRLLGEGRLSAGDH
jgi:hypothetical protein